MRHGVGDAMIWVLVAVVISALGFWTHYLIDADDSGSPEAQEDRPDAGDVVEDPCPPVPECPECPVCTACQTFSESGCCPELESCHEALSRRSNPVSFEPWYANRLREYAEEIRPLQTEFTRLFSEIQALELRVREKGMTGRIREWVDDPEAVALYLDLGERMTELEMLSGRMSSAQQKVESDLWLVYQRAMSESLSRYTTPREFDRLRERMHDLTRGTYLYYLYELRRRERNKGGEE